MVVVDDERREDAMRGVCRATRKKREKEPLETDAQVHAWNVRGAKGAPEVERRPGASATHRHGRE